MILVTFILILFSAILSTVQAPPYPVVYIPVSEKIMPYSLVWDATCYIESRFNPNAIGDLNLKEKSYGIVQIRRSRLDDYYQQTGIRYSVKDMFDTVKSKEVFMFYASQIHHSDLERIARQWNGGERGMQKQATLKYWKLIQARL